MGLILKCPRCGYMWIYKGKRIYAQCTKCFTTFSVKKHRLMEVA